MPAGRRLGKYLVRMGTAHLDALQSIARYWARHLAPPILGYQVKTLSYVPVFVDGTAIEVDGQLFGESPHYTRA